MGEERECVCVSVIEREMEMWSDINCRCKEER